MKTSDTIAEIAKALSIAQSQMTGAKKDSKNPFFKSDYSDLTSVMQAISAPFADNGLCFIQSPGFAEGLITVTTRIIHTSGEWLEGTTCLPPTKNDAQGFGSAITYGKRYSLQAMAGVPSVDDDGQAAVKHAVPIKKTEPKLNAKNTGLCQAMKEALEMEDYPVVYENYRSIGSAEDTSAVWFYFDSKERALMKKEFSKIKANNEAINGVAA